ncbi:MAG: hypothetical protein ACYTFY_13920 [Planctomycetota bacterium]|jgi:hypothetical protein
MADFSCRRFYLLCFLAAAVLTSHLTAADFKKKLNLKIKSCFWGMACADAVSGAAGKSGKVSSDKFVTGSFLKYTRSIVREGGFDPAVCLQHVGGAAYIKNSAYNKESILTAYKELLGRQSALGGKDSTLLLTVPVALAYIRIPDDAYRAAEIAASFKDPDNKILMGSARAFVSLLHTVIRGNYKTRKQALRRSASQSGVTRVRDELERVITDQPLDPVGSNPAEVIAVVFRAWYDSSSYLGALSRLDKNSSPMHRRLLGALAGATYGVSKIPHKFWPGHFSCQQIEVVSNQLSDLAADGVLLEVKELDYTALGQNNRPEKRAMSGPEKDQTVKLKDEDMLMAPPEIPEIPAIPTVPIVNQIPTAPTYKIIDTSKSSVQKQTPVNNAADVPLVKQRASYRKDAPELKLYWK